MLVGRSAETAVLDRLLAAARDGESGVLVIRGEAGIGKSALLEYAVEHADGMNVLRAVGIESESELAFAALHQILHPAFARIDDLPEPQAAALRSAFALSAEAVDDRFRVAAGVLGLLAEIAEDAPVLCVVDDAQWLDRASADALLFTARRLQMEPLALLFAARDDPERQFVVAGVPELRPAPLTVSDARAVVGDRVGDAAADAVDWLIASANGNPLALTELPAALTAEQLSGREPLRDALPPTTSVEEAYLARVNQLPTETQEVLLLAAAEETGDRAAITSAASELGVSATALVAAESAGLVRVSATHVEFRHPLVRSALYRSAGFSERERAHAALASVLTERDEDRRAWHRAAATAGTDDDVAGELERSAERARLRSGHSGAATALQRAAELTADEDARARRLVAAARAAWHAGQPERSMSLLARAAPLPTDPWQHAEAEHVRGLIVLRAGAVDDAGPILISAADEVAPLDSRKAFAMLVDAGSAAGRIGDFTQLADVARRLGALPRSDDEVEGVLADLLTGFGSIIEGKTGREAPLVADAILRAADFDIPTVLGWAAMGAAAIGDEAAETAILRRAVAVARASGEVDTLVLVLEVFVNAAMLAGRYTVEVEAGEGLTLARDAGLVNAATSHLGALAWLAALKGRDNECRTYAAEVAEAVRSSHLANANSAAEWGVAMVDLGRGRPDDAVARLSALRAGGLGVTHPWFVLASTPDLVEACLRSGREEEARAAFAPLQAFAEARAPTWALALAARCRALLAAGDAAEGEFDEALRLHAESNRPFDRARTELLYGEFLRRQRRRTEAREHLRAALEAFEQLRAEPWEERARSELRATGETTRKRDPGTVAQLTPQEEQIARLVGEGGSNKEIAAQLFLSPRTVEYHLRKVFAKLGITSRADLIRQSATAAGEPAPVGASVTS